MELEDDQRAELKRGSRQIRRVADLLRSLHPESFQAGQAARRLCAQAWARHPAEPSVEEVAQGLAGLLRYCPTLGGNTQEEIQANLERLIQRMGLTQEVMQRLTPAAETAHSGRER